jgi:hypothetical protein
MDTATLDLLVKIAAFLFPFLIGVLTLLQAPGRTSSRLKADTEILNNLPEGSAARAAMLELIELQLNAMRNRASRSRDWIGFGIAFAGTPVLGTLAATLILNDSWAWKSLGLVLAFVTLVFLYGLVDSVRLAERDARGNREQGPKGA